MKPTYVTVNFEYTDAHLSIVDDISMIDDREFRCKELCNIFDFEYVLVKKELDCSPHWVFNITFLKTLISFHHYMNVLAAFAQEFQINIANASEREL